MKIILLKTIDSVGREGEVKDVSDGYARNFLLPRKLAVSATAANLKRLAKPVKKNVVKFGKQIESKELAAKLRSITLSFSEKADDKGTLFAGITKEKLAGELVENGLAIKPKQILLSQPIKKTGEYRVEVDLATGVKTEFRIMVQSILK